MYQHILVLLDGSELAECVLPHLEAIGSGCSAKKVTLARVVEPLHMYGGVESRFSPEERQRLDNETKDIARTYLGQVAKRLKQNGLDAQVEVLYGKVIEIIADFVNKNEVDLVIISTHGRSGVSRMVWGSMADRILRSVCAPILMVRAPGCVIGV